MRSRQPACGEGPHRAKDLEQSLDREQLLQVRIRNRGEKPLRALGEGASGHERFQRRRWIPAGSKRGTKSMTRFHTRNRIADTCQSATPSFGLRVPMNRFPCLDQDAQQSDRGHRSQA
jgi:hypothetical protein